MLVYVNKVYVKEDYISFVQLILHDEVNLKNVYYTDTYEKVVAYCRDLKARGNKVMPLLTDRFLIDPSVNTIKLDNSISVEVGVKEESFIETVYGLYSTLARCNSILISDKYPYESGYVGLLSEFINLEISSKNMEVTIPVIYNDEKMDDFKLISQEGDIIFNNRFRVAVPKEKVNSIYRYNLTPVGDIVLNNKEFTMFDYLKDLTIFRVLDFAEVPEPIIVRYTSQQEFYSKTSLLIKKVMSKYNVGSFRLEDNNKLTFSDLFNNYSGVFFRNDYSIKKEDLEKIVDLIIKIGPTLRGNASLDNKKLRIAIQRMLNENNLNPSYTNLLLVVFNIYKVSKNELDLVNSLMVNYSSLKLILLEIDLYLYNLRLNIYNNCKTLYPGKSVVTLKSYEYGVRMEVWKK